MSLVTRIPAVAAGRASAGYMRKILIMKLYRRDNNVRADNG
jgi:hypothetical protein